MNEQGDSSREECTPDPIDDYDLLPLPNIIQLVETELPLKEADNYEQLSGIFLFRQLYNPEENTECLFCRENSNARYSLVSLMDHYHAVHGLTVVEYKAKFSETAVFCIVPPDVSEEKSKCHFCDEVLKNFSEIEQHYPAAHEKTVRFMFEPEVFGFCKYFYCTICKQTSFDFETHHEHMKTLHKFQSNLCKYCPYFAQDADQLHTHLEELHKHPCPVCSECIYGKDQLTKHISQSHPSRTDLDRFSCVACQSQFSSLACLMSHMADCRKLSQCVEVHYKCNICSVAVSAELKTEKTEIETTTEIDTSQDAPVREGDCSHLKAELPGEKTNSDQAAQQVVVGNVVEIMEEQNEPGVNLMDDLIPSLQFQHVCAKCLGDFCSEVLLIAHPCPEQAGVGDQSAETALVGGESAMQQDSSQENDIEMIVEDDAGGMLQSFVNQCRLL